MYTELKMGRSSSCSSSSPCNEKNSKRLRCEDHHRRPHRTRNEENRDYRDKRIQAWLIEQEREREQIRLMQKMIFEYDLKRIECLYSSEHSKRSLHRSRSQSKSRDHRSRDHRQIAKPKTMSQKHKDNHQSRNRENGTRDRLHDHTAHPSSHGPDCKEYSAKRRSNRERSYSEERKRRYSEHDRLSRNGQSYREYRGRSRERRERQRSVEKKERDRSRERRMSTLPHYIEPVPVPTYYGNYPPRPVLMGPMIPIRGPLMRLDEDYLFHQASCIQTCIDLPYHEIHDSMACFEWDFRNWIYPQTLSTMSAVPRSSS